MADRAANLIVVVDSSTYSVVNQIHLTGVSTEPAPLGHIPFWRLGERFDGRPGTGDM